MDIREIYRYQRRVEILEEIIKAHSDMLLDEEFTKCEKYGGHKWDSRDILTCIDKPGSVSVLRSITRKTCMCCSLVADVVQ